MNRDLILSPVEAIDPRLTLDEGALVAASRNAFPVVARQTARRDGAGLLAGGAIALALGGATFWSLSSSRQPPALPARVRVPAPQAALVPAPMPKPAAIPADRTPLPAPLPAGNAIAVAPAASPVMVFDNSLAPPTITSPPRSLAAAPAKPGTPQPLGDNESFAARLGDSGVETASASRLVDPANTITQGTLIAAILETAIDSDLPGYVRAVVSEDVRSFDGSHVLIPRSSRLIGQYKSGLAAGQTRAYVLWTRLIRPDGVSIALASPATDFAGRTGLAGDVDGHFGKRFGAAMLLSAVGGLSAIGSGGVSLVLSGGQSAASVAAQRDAQIPPTIRIRQGQPIRIFTARDLDFSTIAAEPAP